MQTKSMLFNTNRKALEYFLKWINEHRLVLAGPVSDPKTRELTLGALDPATHEAMLNDFCDDWITEQKRALKNKENLDA